MSEENINRPTGEHGDQLGGYEAPMVEDLDTSHGPAVTAAAANPPTSNPRGVQGQAAPRQL